MKTFIVIIVAMMLSCVSATVTAPDVCNSTTVGTVPASPVADLQGSLPKDLLPPFPLDLSDTLKKISDLSPDSSVTVTQLSLTGDSNLQWLTNVMVSIKGDTPDAPDVDFATYDSDGSDPGTSLPLTLKMDSVTAKRYLSQPATLTFALTGTAPTQEVVLSNTMCVEASGKFDKSL